MTSLVYGVILRYEILYRPSYSVLKVELDPGESIEAEAGALMMIEGDVEVKTRGRGLLRALTTGESLFVNIYRAKDLPASLWLAPPIPGDIMYIELDGSKGVIVNDKCYLASHGDVKHRVVWRGLRGVFGGGGLMWLHFTGVGGVWVNAYGSIIEREVGPDEKLIIDNVHLVAMDDTLEYDIRRFGSLKTLLFGGEGFVFTLRGTGRIYLQSRNPTIWYARSRS